MLAPELAEDERFRERFLRESRLAASIDHSNVIPIYEAGEAEGLLFIAMRYVEGTDLKELLATEHKLEPARALAILDQVASALDAAHARGLVHRDVKPANILLDAQEDNHVYLSDFGLTKQASSESGLTQTGQFMGTADYVAPEQIEREPVGPATDEYALACVLYECLSGRAPFRSDSLMGTLWGQVHDQPPPVSDALDPVFATGMAKDPADRYPTCRELVQTGRAALGLSGETPAPAVRAPAAVAEATRVPDRRRCRRTRCGRRDTGDPAHAEGRYEQHPATRAAERARPARRGDERDDPCRLRSSGHLCGDERRGRYLGPQQRGKRSRSRSTRRPSP